MGRDRDDSAAELRQLVREINQSEGEGACRIIPDPGPLFDALRRRFPFHRSGGIDWRKATLVESSGPSSDETNPRLLRRIVGHWRAMRSLASIRAADRVFFLSDDYFDAALDCAAGSVPRVLEEWLRLPHAIAITDPDQQICLHVPFIRSAYLGRSRGTPR